MLSNRTLAFSRRMWNVCSWVCLGLTVIVWGLAFRVFASGGWTLVFWVLLAARVGGVTLLGPQLGPRVSLYADRAVWTAILLVPLFDVDWRGAVVAAGLWTAWGVSAGLGRYWYTLIASEAERARAAELASL